MLCYPTRYPINSAMRGRSSSLSFRDPAHLPERKISPRAVGSTWCNGRRASAVDRILILRAKHFRIAISSRRHKAQGGEIFATGPAERGIEAILVRSAIIVRSTSLSGQTEPPSELPIVCKFDALRTIRAAGCVSWRIVSSKSAASETFVESPVHLLHAAPTTGRHPLAGAEPRTVVATRQE